MAAGEGVRPARLRSISGIGPGASPEIFPQCTISVWMFPSIASHALSYNGIVTCPSPTKDSGDFEKDAV